MWNRFVFRAKLSRIARVTGRSGNSHRPGRGEMAAGEKAEALASMDIEARPDLNTGKAWSEIDLFDLANSFRLGRSCGGNPRFPLPLTARGSRKDHRAGTIGRAYIVLFSIAHIAACVRLLTRILRSRLLT